MLIPPKAKANQPSNLTTVSKKIHLIINQLNPQTMFPLGCRTTAASPADAGTAAAAEPG